MIKDFFNQINFTKLGLAILIILAYMIIIPELVVLLFDAFSLNLINSNIYILANICIYILTIFLILSIYRQSLFTELKSFIKNFKNYGRKSVIYWIEGLLFMLITNSIIIAITNSLAANEAGNRMTIDAFPFFSVISMTILGPFIEEILFRKNFKEAFKNKTVFLIITSLLFGSVHLLASLTENFVWTQLLFLIPYSGFGYFFGKAYLETDNIYTSVFAHMLHNTLSVVLVLIGG